MRICLFGKYPPIQGGVSAQTHWIATQLAQRGHAVHVVTNALEVEPGYRQLFLANEQQFSANCSPNSDIPVTNTSTSPRHSYHHIPFSKAYSHKLFGLGVRLIQDTSPDVLFGWYFEPYAMVATVLGRLYGIPVAVKHAGSDIGRLSQHSDLKEAYAWMLQNAAAVITVNRDEVKSLLLEMGLSKEKFRFAFGSKLPPYFRQADKLSLKDYAANTDSWFSSLGLPVELLEQVVAINKKDLNDHPVIGTYGKVGESKGSFDLIHALSKLADAGREFNFVTIAAGTNTTLSTYYRAILSNKALAKRTWLLPPLPPWRIPTFLNLCDVVCFLERDFPIKFHNPVIPREAIVKGRCLMVSEEIASRQAFSESLVDGKNIVLVNPRDVDRLSAKLEQLLFSYQAIENIAGHAKCLGEFLEGELPDVSSEVLILEDLFLKNEK